MEATCAPGRFPLTLAVAFLAASCESGRALPEDLCALPAMAPVPVCP